jgi:hypothetical protein
VKDAYYEDGIVFPKSQFAGGPGGSGNLWACICCLKAARHRATTARTMTITDVCERGIVKSIVYSGAIVVMKCVCRFLEPVLIGVNLIVDGFRQVIARWLWPRLMRMDTEYPQIRWPPNSQFSVFCMRLQNLGVNGVYWSKFGSALLIGGAKTAYAFANTKR